MLEELLTDYERGPAQLQDALTGLDPSQFDLTPVAGKWSIRQVVCHLADFEPIYADRMKRVLAEENPTLPGADPDLFEARLQYPSRDPLEELQLISVVRSQMARILRHVDIEDFQRTGVHSEDGPLTLEALLERITGHIPHHVKFIREKMAAM